MTNYPSKIPVWDGSPFRPYSPSAYDPSLSVYEELVMIREYLNKMIKNFNDNLEWSNNNFKTIYKALDDMIKEIERFEKDIIEVVMPESLVKILNEWYENGKLAEIINEQVFNMKADKAKLLDFGINLEDFPRQTGETDDSARFTRLLATVGDNGAKIIIPQGKVFTGNFLINKSNIILTGGGTLKGQINLYGTEIEGSDRFIPGSTGDIHIDGITIDGETTRNGINMKWVYGTHIVNCIFKDCVRAINFESVDRIQHCSRTIVSNNTLVDNNYGIYVDESKNASGVLQMGVGDLTVTANMFESRKNTFGNMYHLYLRGMDGLVCKDNTMFFGATGKEVNNIDIIEGNYVQISGNQLFEAEQHAINIKDVNNLIITDNNITRTKKESVVLDNVQTVKVDNNNFNWRQQTATKANLTGVYIKNSPYFNGTVNSNSFFFPNEHCIKIEKTDFVDFIGNDARNFASDVEPFMIDYGLSNNIMISNNSFTNFKKKIEEIMTVAFGSVHIFNNNEGGLAVTFNSLVSPPTRAYQANATTIDVSYRSLIVFANTAPTLINKINSEDLAKVQPRVIELYSYNSNTSIDRTMTNVVIKGDTPTVTIPAGGSMRLLAYGGFLRELSRSFPITTT